MLPHVQPAAACVRAGGVLVYPTETVYGIGGDPAREDVVRRIQALKGRDADKPMLLLTDTWDRALPWVAEVTPVHRRIMAHEPPLPVTLLFVPTPAAPAAFRGKSDKIGIRRTPDPFCRAVIAQADRLLLSTSANPAGAPPPRAFDDIAPELLAGADYAVDAGRPLAGVPSTVVDVVGGRLHVVRAGAVSEAQLAAVLAGKPIV